MSDRSGAVKLIADMLLHITRDMPVLAKLLVYTAFIDRVRRRK